MKKILIVSILMLLFAGSIFAQGIELGEFPVGKWVDENYGAVWEFSSQNIRILDKNGGVYFDFRDKTINDFKVSASLKGVLLSFSCEESGRAYQFLKPPTNLNLDMTIDTDWGKNYMVNMPFFK